MVRTTVMLRMLIVLATNSIPLMKTKKSSPVPLSGITTQTAALNQLLTTDRVVWKLLPQWYRCVKLVKSQNDLGSAVCRVRGWSAVCGPTELGSYLGQPVQHVLASRPVGQNGFHTGRYFGGGEIVLHEFWYNFFSSDQVDHGEAWDFHPWLSKYVREGRDAVDHHEGSVHHGGFDGCCPAGDDSGA